MKQLIDLVTLASKFDTAHVTTAARFEEWSESKYALVVDTLKKAKDTMEANVKYLNKNLFIDNEPDNKSSIRFRSGKNPIPNTGDGMEWFEISFIQINNGKILAYFKQYENGQSKQQINLILIDDVSTISEAAIFEILYMGLEEAIKDSFLFIGDN